MSVGHHAKPALFTEAQMSPLGTKKWSLLPGVGAPIMEYLRAEFPAPATPAQITAGAGLPKASHAAVKKWLQRKNGTWVIKTVRGWYRARADPQLMHRIGLDPIKLHALQVEIMSPVQGRPPAIEGQRDSKDPNTIHAAWQGRKITAQQTKQGGLFVSMRATTDPLTVEEFGQWTAWLYGVAGNGSVMLRNFDLATDTADHLMRLRGLEAMQLGDFHGAVVKIYNKQVIEATRLETCFHRLDLGLAEAAHLLHSMTARPAEPPAPAFYGPTSGVSPYDFI